jgi:catechol 2,3-dioxygenase-like lactoylglutathione lyase family enzyme
MDKPAVHHVALACKDLGETHHFYADLMGLRLVRTEVDAHQGGYLKHVFYDLGDGSCVAFFDLHGVGEPENFPTAISTDLGLPPWVNHLALRADHKRVDEVKARMAEEGIEPSMRADHGWCQSTYFTDPNGIMVELCVDTPGFDPDPEEAERLRKAMGPSG